MAEGVTVALAALGIMATIVGVLVWLLKKLFTQNETTVQDNSKSNAQLASAIARLADASEETISASKARDEEQRSFQQLVIQKLDGLDGKADSIYQVVSDESKN